MKKIGLCACYDTNNYGSMLQTLATCIQLDKLGYEYEIIVYTRKLTFQLFLNSIDRIPEFINKFIKKNYRNIKLCHYKEIKTNINCRNKRFESFRKKYFIKMSSVYYTFDELKKASYNYDAFLVGSDQLWRPEGFTTGFYNLLFVPDNILKISYATSFGVSQIPKNKQKIAKKFLNRIDYISVRELRASEIVQELTGRNVPTVVDPTLLFTGAEWESIIPKKSIINEGEKYIFCYLLGKNPLHRNMAKKLSQVNGYKIVVIPHLDEFVEEDINFGDYQLFDVGPDDFVNLIRYAEYVCTDSFHGTVFSILYHKKFITFNRFSDENKDSRNSRIDSLLSLLSLEGRRLKEEIDNVYEFANEDINYDFVDEKLADLRKESIEFLERALGDL